MHPERLSALRSLVRARDNWQTSERNVPRENDDACAQVGALPRLQSGGLAPPGSDQIAEIREYYGANIYPTVKPK